ncbi:trans-aconitate 2-methyltransferase [Microvirga pudoricolor]|uniref:trans-aconitate 2-methyltransferase n=1 Tax=Microvirga pudoricolor TaxID=2778729 RepID=UPI00194F1B36|nr:trans-aconitate 2-methyltransferase [Microvirga pudoricolor]MBM6592457.1 trans-aconitate 2-methyltransferase [Microvirga pudoricolor]
MNDWSANLYLKFEDERTRPAVELLARVPLAGASRVTDLGCGPGNSTELLSRRFPDALVTGIDTSPDMLDKARVRVPGARFEQADIGAWQPDAPQDLIFANAALQWVPDHRTLLPRLASFLSKGGCLAVQVPNNLSEASHALMRDVARSGPWSRKLQGAAVERVAVASLEEIYAWLIEAGCTVDIWRTIYVHPLDGPDAIVEWLKSTGLKPFIDPLDEEERRDFLARYRDAIAGAYPLQSDGKVLLRFPRLSFVARKA